MYGINTGFGGSADTRTAHVKELQLSLVTGQQIGILPVASLDEGMADSLPISDEPLSQPEAWVRGAMIVRLNSLVRGHSAVRWVVLETMQRLMANNVVPVVPVRSSISASGDLSPLSYVAGALAGLPGVQCWVDGADGRRKKVYAPEALARYNIAPISLEPKEGLGLLNGTAFSTSVGALVMHDANMLALVSQITTAMGCEAMLATDGSFDPFIHDVCRPHRGQVEAASHIHKLLEGSQLATHHADEEHVLASDDSGTLRQDRYCWRTAAQWVGPQLEDLQAATQAVETELNTTTDNPLLDADTDKMYHGGNFQAQAITNAMEKTRLSLALLGKMQFAQTAELVDPAKNRGLPANLSAGDVSLDFGFKAVDIATAAVCSELQALASPVATHVQSAELGNQALNSLALISGRQTVRSIECLSQLFAWSLYMITQAFDLRALQRAHLDVLHDHLKSSLKASFGLWITDTDLNTLVPRIYAKVTLRMDEGAHRPMLERLDEAYRSATQELVQYLATAPSVASGKALQALVDWRETSVHQMEKAYYAQVQQMHEQPYGCHASPLLSPLTRRIYEYVRKDLNVPVMGKQCFWMYQGEEGKLSESMGNQASRIYRAIRNGDLYQLIADVAQELE
ncbi:phenylalanine ammonia-lyase [Ceraceosorus guamensis]|uniref:Phenylalanine ammonia-lyase n=1 Tax=Ceraceosorus guamensis TaxID=1522189 RepID=A0A316W1M7_9BASI|nr:phenylalanine ammonia-lyase [Ceraceosorus guamensis]PWN42673.1 phenylalanine ammonia-lyase [Ceraceosorus guamensis]